MLVLVDLLEALLVLAGAFLMASATLVGLSAVLISVIAFVLGRRSRLDWRRARTPTLAIVGVAVAGLACLGASLGLANYVESVRKRTLVVVDRSAQPLVAALESYRELRGRYPRELAQLVPEFLAQKPATGWGSCPSFAYRSDGSEVDLRVRLGGFAGRFVYRPPQPDDQESWAKARAGDWVWIDD